MPQLLVIRHTVRDYLDTVVLCERLGETGVAQAMRSFEAIYRQPTTASPLAEVVERLAAAAPSDATEVRTCSTIAPFRLRGRTGRTWLPAGGTGRR